MTMRSNFDIEIRWKNGERRSIPFYATNYQAHKVLTALGFALNMSEVDEIVMWACWKDSKGNERKVQHNRISYVKAEKAHKAA
jgi:hypothetical protein